MSRRISRNSAVLAVMAVLALLLLASVPAMAHHKDDHGQGGGSDAAAAQESDAKGDNGKPAKDNDGDADSNSSTAYTEDNDTNDGDTPNNVPDDGDNAHPSGKDRSVENGGSGNQGNSESDPDDDGRGPDRSNGGADKPNGPGGTDKADQDGNNGCGNDDDFEDDNEGWCGKPPAKPAPTKPVRPEVKPAGPCDADDRMNGTQPCKEDKPKPCEADAGMTGTEPCLDADVLPTEPCVDDATMAGGAEACDKDGDEDAGVLGGVITRPATPDVEVEEGPDVLGERLSQPVEGEGVVAAAAERGASFLGRQLPFTGSALLGFGAIAVGLLLAGAGILATRRSVG